MIGDSSDSESHRLEQLWGGEFGDDYVTRNLRAGQERHRFWSGMLAKIQPASVLEVGCNVGANLQHVLRAPSTEFVCGVDINPLALRALQSKLHSVDSVQAAARHLPFKDSSFDLVFTVGVLIHQPDSSLAAVMREIARCTRRFVICAEYFSLTPAEVPYRGERGALFKRDYGRLYLSSVPDLRLEFEDHLDKSDGFDDVTCHVFKKG